MNCPRCGNMMTEIEKHGVMIDLCGSCGGIWLDKGELAKILGHMREAEQSLDNELNAARQAPPTYRQEYDSRYQDRRYEHEEHHHGDDRHEYDHHYGHRKKTGFQKLFDIFD